MWQQQQQPPQAGSDDDPLPIPDGFASANEYAAYLDAAVRDELQRLQDTEPDDWWAEAEAAAMDAIVETHLGDDSVVCPLCMVRPVRLHHGILSCECGLHLALGQDAWTIATLGERLREVAELHSDQCAAVPRFYVTGFGAGALQVLMLHCQQCGASTLVL